MLNLGGRAGRSEPPAELGFDMFPSLGGEELGVGELSSLSSLVAVVVAAAPFWAISVVVESESELRCLALS